MRWPGRTGTSRPQIPARDRVPLSLLTGFFGVVYLALTVGWILAVQYHRIRRHRRSWARCSGSSASSRRSSPRPLWFGATLTLTRGGRLVTRAGWLALGAGLLVPWPLLPLLAAVA